MRKIAVLLILAVMLFSAVTAFAAGGSGSSGKSGWQCVYDSIASWSWSSGSSAKSK